MLRIPAWFLYRSIEEYRAALLCLAFMPGQPLLVIVLTDQCLGEISYGLSMAQAASVKTEVKKQNFTPIERRCKGNWLILVKSGAV